MFQYAFCGGKIIENTGLITRSEAEALWNRYQDDIRDKWEMNPQMCIWVNCDSNTDYSTIGREIDWYDCELKNGEFYRVTKTKC